MLLSVCSSVSCDTCVCVTKTFVTGQTAVKSTMLCLFDKSVRNKSLVSQHRFTFTIFKFSTKVASLLGIVWSFRNHDWFSFLLSNHMKGTAQPVPGLMKNLGYTK